MVSVIGSLTFHMLDDYKINVHPDQGEAFDLIQSKVSTIWYFDGFADNQRWRNLNNQGTMRLVYDNKTGGSVEVARLTGTKLEFKRASLEGEGGWNGVVLSAVAMREQKIRETEKDEMGSELVKGFLGSFVGSSVS